MHYQDVVWCMLTPEFQRVARNTQESTVQGRGGQDDAEAYLQSVDLMIRIYMRERPAVASAIWPLGLKR